MFLFDKYRTSQQHSTTGDRVEVRWRTHLRTNPAFGAESTAAIDDDGNFYFGSHSGNFYSLDKDGRIRWSFYTKEKIYPSPVFYGEMVLFSAGDGFLYALNKCDGSVVWMFNLAKGFGGKLQKLLHLPYTYNFKRKRIMDTRCWSSPLLIDKCIYITAYGKGAYCIGVDGKEIWSMDLGFPRFHLSGFVADKEDYLYFASRKGLLHKVSLDGKKVWAQKLRYQNVWGNPSYDNVNNLIYVPQSKSETRGLISAYTTDGKLQWTLTPTSAVYGSVAISPDSRFICFCDFAGWLYKVDPLTGHVLLKVRLCSCARALWTTPTIDSSNSIYLTTKDNGKDGRIIKLNENLQEVWSYALGKALSVPVILPNGDVVAGSWDGHYYCFKTKEE